MALIVSVEYVEIEIGAGETTDSANLTKSQTISKCVPFMTCKVAGQLSEFDQILLDVEIEAGPIVTVTRTTAGGTISVGVTVIEFGTDATIQQGAFGMIATEGSDTVNIDAVTESKAALITNYLTNGVGNTLWGPACVRGKFNTSSQLIFERDNSTGAISGHWFVFECNGTEFSVQAITDHIIASEATEKTTTIDAITMNKTFLISTFKTAGTNDDAENYTHSVKLASSTTLYSQRGYAKNETVDTHVFVISFSGTQIVQRGTFNYDSAQETDTISAVNLTWAMPWNANRQGHMQTEGSSAADIENVWNRVKLTSTTVVTGDRTDGQASVGEWEVIEWYKVLYSIEGKTYSKNRAILATCKCLLMKDNEDDSATVIDYTTSDGSGDYEFADMGDDDNQYFVYAWKDDSPHVADCTDHVLLPKETPDTSYDLYLRSDADKGETSPDKDLRLRSQADKLAKRRIFLIM